MRKSCSIFLFLFILFYSFGWAQSPTNPTPASFNFGFTSNETALSTNIVKPNTNRIATDNHVYFINNADNKIYDVVWNAATSTWSTATAPLGGTSVPAVKTGTNIVNYGDELFFVAQTDNKIYRLKWTSGPGWQYTLLYSSQIPVAGSNITLKTHPTGCEIYYIGNTGKIYQLYFNGTTWFGGAQLSSLQTVNALTTSPLVCSSTAVYYIGSADNKIYRVYWGGSSWTGGNLPLVSTSTPVRGLSNIVNENNDLDHLYYINSSNQICEIVNSGAWTYSVVPTGTNVVRSNTDIVCSYGSIFYVKSTDSKIWRAWKTVSWNNLELNASAASVVSSGQLFVWTNDIIEEGTLNATFKSYHVFYPSSGNIIRTLVYDDPICEFHAFCCTDPCDKLIPSDGSGDGIGYQDPTTGNIVNPSNGCGYSCASCVGLPKVWHYGNVPCGSLSLSVYKQPFNVVGKHFYFVATDSKIYDFTRGAYYSQISVPPNWSDEFNGTALSSNWKKANYGNAWKCYNEFWNFPSNVNVAGNVLDIVAKNASTSPSSGPEHLPATIPQTNIWVGAPNCFESPSDGLVNTNDTYNYSSGLITTDPAGPGVFPQRPALQYGYIEARLKIARGKHFWSTFFLYYGGTEDINFEFDGNGKTLITTLYQPTWYPTLTTYAIGYRYYDDYYTYAVNWPSNGAPVGFYVNNELVGSYVNGGGPGYATCINPHTVIVSLEVDNQVRALCEAEIFPQHYYVDYIRAFSTNVSWRSSIPSELDPNIERFTFFPNPAQGLLTIDGVGFQKAEIYTIQGKKIYESSSPIINVENFSSGVYLLKIIDEKGKIQNSKFIKE